MGLLSGPTSTKSDLPLSKLAGVVGTNILGENVPGGDRVGAGEYVPGGERVPGDRICLLGVAITLP